MLIAGGPCSPPATTPSPSNRRTTGTPPTTRSSSTPTPGSWSPSACLYAATATTARRGNSPARRNTVGNTTAIADGGYRGTGLVIPHRRERGQAELPAWREEHNASHRKVRARIEHAFARMKSWKILRDCHLDGDGAYHSYFAGHPNVKINQSRLIAIGQLAPRDPSRLSRLGSQRS
ncbi:transposase [Streptomyces cynarae]|uniref:transposase n=1 Tax=Streptomyces cynarae TaxID=2981134 RepID=UPI00406C40C6